MANTDIADLTGPSRPTVLSWRGRYEQSGVDGLDHDPRPGRATVIDEVAVLAETLADNGNRPTIWRDALVDAVDGAAVRDLVRVGGPDLAQMGIQPHRAEMFKSPTDPQLEAKCATWSGSTCTHLPVR